MRGPGIEGLQGLEEGTARVYEYCLVLPLRCIIFVHSMGRQSAHTLVFWKNDHRWSSQIPPSAFRPHHGSHNLRPSFPIRLGEQTVRWNDTSWLSLDPELPPSLKHNVS